MVKLDRNVIVYNWIDFSDAASRDIEDAQKPISPEPLETEDVSPVPFEPPNEDLDKKRRNKHNKKKKKKNEKRNKGSKHPHRNRRSPNFQPFEGELLLSDLHLSNFS